MRILTFSLLATLILATGCQKETAQGDKPVPIELTEEAAGHYCQMVILEHSGPKGQLHLVGFTAPLWFSQVRDGLAYWKSAEKTAEIAVLYVNDMGKAASWAKPGIDNWIDVEHAFFVVGSNARGGMGAPEIVPFGNEKKAKNFVVEMGGQVMRLAEISADMVLAPVELAPVDLAKPIQSDPDQEKL